MGETALSVATPPNPGAIGLIQVFGPGTTALLARLTGRGDWPHGRLRLVELAQLDQGFAVLMRDDWAQVMPHGGPRLIQLLVDRLIEWGAVYAAEPTAAEQYPEATCPIEAEMLRAVAEAASPLAVDLLAAQARLWRGWVAAPRESRNPPDEILRQSETLNGLIDPPSVVVVGRPNVGKSTLSNHVLGRAASIVADLPGTTRDWVAGLAELLLPAPAAARLDAPNAQDTPNAHDASIAQDHPTTFDVRLSIPNPHRAIAVRWLDTPGLRRGRDPVEQKAIDLARQVIVSADVLVVMRDPSTDWPHAEALPRSADLWVVNKVDLVTPPPPPGAGTGHDDPIAISAADGTGVDRLTQRIAAQLGLADLADDLLWAFCDGLRKALVAGEDVALRDFVGAG